MNATEINSRRAYQVIKRAAQKWLQNAGFRGLGSSGQWVKTLSDDQELYLGFQCDKNGWDWSGNQFTLNFDLIDLREKHAPLATCRYGKLVNAPDGDVWTTLTNRVVAKLQGVKQPPLYDWEYPEQREWDLTPETSFVHKSDPWMRFYQEEDITRWWVEFLQPRMDEMLQRFLSLPRRRIAGEARRTRKR